MNKGDETPGGVMSDSIGNRTDPYGWVTYNGTHVPGTIKYVSIYSDYDGTVPNMSSLLDGAVNIEFNQLGLIHSELYSNQQVL